MMEWVEVDSSQIKAVGHDAETNTLGVRFHPGKRDREAGLPFSEYHYRGVNGDMFQAMRAAESVGTWFGENIKRFPERYPFTKIVLVPQAGSLTAAIGETDAES